MKTLLISGLGGSLFPYLHHQLEKKYQIVYIDADTGLKRLYPDLLFYPAPLVSDTSYPAFVKELVRKHRVNYYVPLIDEELLVAHSLNLEDEYDCKVIAPRADFVELTLNKLELMHRLKQAGISNIPTWKGDDTPPAFEGLIAKPISGRGSRGVKKVDAKEEYEAYLTLEKRDPTSVLLQRCYEGKEYTVGVLVDAENNLLAISSRKVIVKKGVTVRAVTVNEPVIDELVDSIQSTFKPSGPYNVQLIIDQSGTPRIFEINPRFSTTLVMSYAGGLDEISLYIEGSKKSEGIQRPATDIELYRTWQNNFLNAC